MLRKLRVRAFKSLADVTVEFPRLSVLFGPNSVGKSNLLEAIRALSRIGTQSSLADALQEDSIRGHPFEAFALPAGGIPELASTRTGCFSIEADVAAPWKSGKRTFETQYRYEVEVGIFYRSGSLSMIREHLERRESYPPKRKAAIEQHGSAHLSVPRQSPGRPREVATRQKRSVLSQPQYSRSRGYDHIHQARAELRKWRTYHLDPRVAMRAETAPLDTTDIGTRGEHLVPVLHNLKDQHRKHFDAIVRTARTIIPGLDAIDVQLDTRRGTLDLSVSQDGTPFSSRVVSEGTLRVLALCAIVVNPKPPSLIALEEPENGVHPRRVELIAEMLTNLALQPGRQVIVTTHSPVFCNAVLREARDRESDEIGLIGVRRDGSRTEVRPLDLNSALFNDPEVAEALRGPVEDHLFESLILTGFIDE